MTERHPSDAHREYAAQQDAAYSFRTESRTQYDAQGYPVGWQGPKPVAPMFTGESLDNWKKDRKIESDEHMWDWLHSRGLQPLSRHFKDPGFLSELEQRKR